MPDFTKLWNVTYLFGPNPIEMSRSDFWFFIISSALVFISLVFKIVAIQKEIGNPVKHLFNRLFHLCLTIGFFALVWSGLRFENIPWLATHVVVLVLYLIFLVWLGFILYYSIRWLPKQIRLWRDEKTKQKYLSI